MDDKDRLILQLLQRDAKTTQAEIGARVGLSAGSVNERIRKLERDGAIRKWTILVDDQAVGAELTVFIEVFIESPEFEDEFVSLMEGLPEIQECHFVTGEFTCLLKAKVESRGALRNLVFDRINAFRGVRQTRTYLALATTKEDPGVFVPAPEPGPSEGGR